MFDDVSTYINAWSGTTSEPNIALTLQLQVLRS